MKTLQITHDAGFFSCCSKRLEAIIYFFNTYKLLPQHIDSTKQFSLYKNYSSDDAISLYFQKEDMAIAYEHAVRFHNDAQFLPYQQLDLVALQPFIKKYFSPSEQVQQAVSLYEKKYTINYANTCAVYYRGNDKGIETAIASYDTFITKAKEIKRENPAVEFLVQTDEREFLEAFLRAFPDSISFEEIQPMAKKNSFVAAELAPAQHVEHGLHFFASIIVLSKCKYIVTHSGNGALWCVLYKGNTKNVFQWLNNAWNPKHMTIRTMWQRNKRYVKKIFRTYPGWAIISS